VSEKLSVTHLLARFPFSRRPLTITSGPLVVAAAIFLGSTAFGMCRVLPALGRDRTRQSMSAQPVDPVPRKRKRTPPAPPAASEPASDEPWYVRAWAGQKMDSEYRAYMATEWGVPKRGELALFEKISLEGAQAGLSWRTILGKREAYRKAFLGFDVDRVAAISDGDIDALLQKGGGAPEGRDAVVRHRGKLLSVVANARCVQRLRTEHVLGHLGSKDALDDLLWSFVGYAPIDSQLRDAKSMPTVTPAAERMSKELKRLGFRFVGPTTCYSLMQASGMVIDHPVGTPEHATAVARARELFGG
jgi:DNA-3-methyladenine glycosylase I